MNTRLMNGLTALVLAGGTTLAAAIYEERFDAYPDYSPMLENWMYRGVAGEVIGGAYLFTGVNQKSAEYWDVNPEDAQMLVRDFPAGPSVKTVARFTAMPHPFNVFEPGKNSEQRCGLLIQSRKFQRRVRLPADQPNLSLFLKQSKDGKRSFELEYTGKPSIPLKTEQALNGTWKQGHEYELALSLSGDTVTGTVREGGREIWRKTLRSPEFRTVFANAYPGVRNYRMTGKLSYFRADNLDSASAKRTLHPLSVPEIWRAADGQTVQFRPGEKVNLRTIFGGKKEVTLFSEVSVPEHGDYVLKGNADWFWKLVCNGETVGDFMKTGNGKGGRIVVMPLKKGKNRLELTVKPGSSGWSFSFSAPSREEIRARLIRNYTYGSDVLLWNLDRLTDDLANLRRRNVALPEVEREVQALRTSLPADLTAKEIRQHDPLLDRAYGRIYDAYRYLELLDALSELRESGVSAPELAELDRLAAGLKKQLLAGKNIEKDARKAQSLLDSAYGRMNGVAEGVTRGGSFGRFGWVTSASLGDYSSGDGLLANQVLSDGAIARQYVFSPENPKLYWQIRFRFEGERDPDTAKRLGALPVTGPNSSVEFGYDPTQFYSGSTPGNVKVNAISWTRKQFTCGDLFTADMNLLSPALLLESAHRVFVLADSPTGAFTNIGWLNGKREVRSEAIAGNGVVYDRDRDGELGSNWIVLWNGANAEQDLAGHRGSIPLQVIFQRKPRTIVRKDGELKIQFDRNGAVWLNTLYGAPLQATGNWRGKLPFAAVEAAEFFGRSALAQPEDCREFYRYDKDRKTVEIINKYKFREFAENDWGIKPLKLAVLPPVLSLMADRGFDAVLPDELRDLNYPTIYGPLYGVEGAEIAYTLPVPDIPQYSIARNAEGDPKDVERVRRHGMDDIEGSRFRLYDERLSRAWHSISFPGGEASKLWQYWSPVYQQYLNGMFRYMMKESAGYRTNRVWRSLTEPYSGRKYFYSFSIGADYPGDVGVFGDRGYGVGLHLNALEQYSSMTGDTGRLKALWRDNSPLASPDAVRDGRYLTVDKMLGYVKNVHDWAWMDDGSNDSGDNGPVVDCSQAPFAGHCAYFRIAQRVGNEREIAKGAYHLAKSQLPLIARPAFLDYGRRNGLVGVDHINVGFREFITPNSFSNQSMHAANERNIYVASYASLLSYAGRDEGLDIYYPYSKYIWNDLRRFQKLCAQYFPNGDTESFQWSAPLATTLMFRILNGEKISAVRRIYETMSSKTIFYIRNGMDRDVLSLILAGGCPLLLTDWAPLPLPDFQFVPSAKKAVVTLERVPEKFRLGFLSSQEPAAVTVNGKSGSWKYDSATHRLFIPVPAGKKTSVEIRFDRIDMERFAPFPLPEPARTVPGIVPETGNWRRSASMPKKTESAAIAEKQLYHLLVSGSDRFLFHNWGKGKNHAAGGFTGNSPRDGQPPRALEIRASVENFCGYARNRLSFPAGSKALVVTGRVMRSADYSGNVPMVFLWFPKSNKPVFYQLPAGKNGEWQEFRFECTDPALLNGGNEFILNLTTQLDPRKGEPRGAVFYQNIRVFSK